MGDLLVRDVDENVKKALQRRAQANGRSLSAETRYILERAAEEAQEPESGKEFYEKIRHHVKTYGGLDGLPVFDRKSTPIRDLPDFSSDDYS